MPPSLRISTKFPRGKTTPRLRCLICVGLGAYFALALATRSDARSVYLNGEDISSARGSVLKNVVVRIDENGNVFIDGPQYSVHKESTYVPLNQYVSGVNVPAHQPTPMNPATGKPLAKINGPTDTVEKPAAHPAESVPSELPPSGEKSTSQPELAKAGTKSQDAPADPTPAKPETPSNAEKAK